MPPTTDPDSPDRAKRTRENPTLETLAKRIIAIISQIENVIELSYTMLYILTSERILIYRRDVSSEHP